MKKMMISLVTCCATLSADPGAIVFDFGGVMTKEPNRELVIEFLCKSLDLSSKEFEKVNQEKRKAVQSGKKDQDFWLDYAKEKNISLPKNWEAMFNQVLKEAIGINNDMFYFVNKLKKRGIPIALLSNIDDRLAKLFKEFKLYEPFDPCLLSCEIGLEKPDPKIYEFLLETMQMPANAIVFVDDREENIEAARKLGFDALLFTSQRQLQKDLEKRGLF